MSDRQVVSPTSNTTNSGFQARLIRKICPRSVGDMIPYLSYPQLIFNNHEYCSQVSGVYHHISRSLPDLYTCRDHRVPPITARFINTSWSFSNENKYSTHTLDSTHFTVRPLPAVDILGSCRSSQTSTTLSILCKKSHKLHNFTSLNNTLKICT